MYLTYMTGQVLLVLGMSQGQGAGWQLIAGGFHLIPGLLVYVLEGLKKSCEYRNCALVSPHIFSNPGAFFQCEV